MVRSSRWRPCPNPLRNRAGKFWSNAWKSSASAESTQPKALLAESLFLTSGFGKRGEEATSLCYVVKLADFLTTGMLRTLSRLWKIGISRLQHGILIPVSQLTIHGSVAGL